MASLPHPRVVVDRMVLESFCQRALVKSGASVRHAEICARVLVLADRRGIHSHGVNRLEMYCYELRSKEADGKARGRIVRETPSVALVDGQNGLGMPLGDFCMRLAIRKAKSTGVGWVVLRGSNHYGIAGYYALLAVERGLIGLSFTNTSPLVVPTRAKKAAVGTNPIACAAPAASHPAFCLDMATSAVALGKVEVQSRKREPVPRGWGVDQEGRVTEDADLILEKGGLSPLGGPEETSGYKGYGLALMVEVFCGLLSDSKFGPQVAPWRKGRGEPANVGQCFVAIDPRKFRAGFPDRMSTLIDLMKGLEPSDPAKPILVPGEPEYQRQLLSDREGVSLHQNIFKALQDLAKDLQIAPPETKASL